MLEVFVRIYIISNLPHTTFRMVGLISFDPNPSANLVSVEEKVIDML